MKGDDEESPAKPPESDEKIDVNKMNERNQENSANVRNYSLNMNMRWF